MKEREWLKKSAGVLERYKYVLLAVLAGVVLLAWPAREASPAPEPAAEGADPFDVSAEEERLARTLSQIQGAGEVQVMLTVERGPRQLLAQNGTADAQRRETSTVVLSRGTGQQEPAVLQLLAPEYRGAVVVSPGGGDSGVALALTRAVSTVTGLGADRITICQSRDDR